MTYQGYIQKYLDIKVYKDKTIIKYCNNDNICFVHEYTLGIDKIGKELANEIIMSNWISEVIYTLNQISLKDRVPTVIYLYTEKYSTIFEKFLKHKETYSQFYIENVENAHSPHVIIRKINYAIINSHLENALSHKDLKENNSNQKSKTYERYTKAISQFKI